MIQKIKTSIRMSKDTKSKITDLKKHYEFRKYDDEYDESDYTTSMIMRVAIIKLHRELIKK